MSKKTLSEFNKIMFNIQEISSTSLFLITSDNQSMYPNRGLEFSCSNEAILSKVCKGVSPVVSISAALGFSKRL